MAGAMLIAGAGAPSLSWAQSDVQARVDQPWRLSEALKAPDWLSVSGQTRARYETLNNQFRAGLEGDDQALFFRTLLHIKADAGPVAFGVEFQDSRGYLTDSGTPLTSSFVNPFDVLQAYMQIDAPGILDDGGRTKITLGRQTVSIGSKRQIERVSYANVIKNYTGLHAVSYSSRGDELHLFAVSPLSRRPQQRADIDNNVLVFDREQLGRRIWGMHYRRADFAPMIAQNIWGEAFIYGLHESDRANAPTPNRRYVAPGFRFYRKPERAAWDMDIEGSVRFGARRATSAANDVEDLDVDASMLIARVGYTFDLSWRPRIALQYYWASGDNNPNDDRFDQYERLFGSRRTDLNNTSIHGPLTPANLSAPGVRFDIKPSDRIDARLHYSAASLASDRDAWVIARLRDEAGLSGDFIGHTLDARARYWLKPGNVLLDVGASALIFGDFAKNVPGGPQGTRTLFGYAQAVIRF